MATLNTRIQSRIDTKANWQLVEGTDIPLLGEICIATSEEINATTNLTEKIYRIKVGDGTSLWKDLPYIYSTKQEIDDEILEKISDLNNIGNVSLSSISDNQILRYNIENSEWENKDAPKEFQVSSSKPTDDEVTLWFDTSEVYGDGQIIVTDYNSYTTEEQVVGCWINGKPIYRIVVSSTSSGCSYSNSDLEQVVKLNTMAYDSTFGSWFIDAGMGGSDIRKYSSANPGYVDINYFRASDSFTKCIMIVEYTKTTDAENSFDTSMLTYKSTDEITETDISDVVNMV